MVIWETRSLDIGSVRDLKGRLSEYNATIPFDELKFIVLQPEVIKVEINLFFFPVFLSG